MATRKNKIIIVTVIFLLIFAILYFYIGNLLYVNFASDPAILQDEIHANDIEIGTILQRTYNPNGSVTFLIRISHQHKNYVNSLGVFYENNGLLSYSHIKKGQPAALPFLAEIKGLTKAEYLMQTGIETGTELLNKVKKIFK